MVLWVTWKDRIRNNIGKSIECFCCPTSVLHMSGKNPLSPGTVTVRGTLLCPGRRQRARAAPHGDGWRGEKMKRCRNDVRAQPARPVSRDGGQLGLETGAADDKWSRSCTWCFPGTATEERGMTQYKPRWMMGERLVVS